MQLKNNHTSLSHHAQWRNGHFGLSKSAFKTGVIPNILIVYILTFHIVFTNFIKMQNSEFLMGNNM